ncbi:MAG: apolipoprotein N-acyltransferase [Gammaproteobacteria bacterium]|nr:apolipoprotein N-acyltransferase [Gammaproteobacteria bacterium]
MFKQPWSGNVIALIAGGLLPLSFSPFHYYPVAVLSLALLFSVWNNITAKQAALRGFLFGIGMFGVGISWIYVAIHDFGQANMALAGLLTALFVSFMASYLAVLGWGINRLSKGNLTAFDTVLLLPVAWLFFEWFKGWFLTGLPWLEVGAGQIDGPLSGYTPVISVLGVSLLTAISAGLLVIVWQKRQWWPIFAFTLIWAGGSLLKSQQWTYPVDDEIQVSVIQGNIPQAMKWDPEQLFKTLALYQARTEENWDSDLIIWPENAVTVFHHQAKEFFLDPLAIVAQENETELVLGLPVLDQETGHYYNSMMTLGEQEAFYYKSHLVPFGDYIPLEWLRGLIKFFDLPMSAFRPGPVSTSLLTIAGQPIGLSICYEDTFSTEILRGLPKATVLINATNNSWYGDSFAPHQHLQISQNRALEMGRPLVRSTTNGISALIDSKGGLRKQTAQFEEAVMTGHIQPRQGKTPYVNWGQTPLLLLSLFMLVVWAYYRRINKDNQAD